MKLVLVHGLLGSSLNWGPIVTRLRANPELANWEVLTVDLLGHAYRKIPDSKNEITIAEMANDLLSQVPEGPFVALGHSFGLRPLLEITKTDPQRISALIVEDSSPQMDLGTFHFLRKVFDGTPVPFSTRELAKDYFNQEYGRDSALSRFLLSNIKEQLPGVHDWRFNHEALNKLLLKIGGSNQWGEWQSYPGQIYLIRGENSDFVTTERAEECVAKRKSGTIEVHQIAQSGHWVHAEQPQGFVDALVKILKQLG